MTQCFIDHTKSSAETVLRQFKSLEYITSINKLLLFYEYASSECFQH